MLTFEIHENEKLQKFTGLFRFARPFLMYKYIRSKTEYFENDFSSFWLDTKLCKIWPREKDFFFLIFNSDEKNLQFHNFASFLLSNITRITKWSLPPTALSAFHLWGEFSASDSFWIIKSDLGKLRSQMSTLSVFFSTKIF